MTGLDDAQRAALEARVIGLETRVTELTQVVNELTVELSRGAAGGRGSDVVELDLVELDVWVREWLLPTFPRLPGSTGGHWCRQWWTHPEAMFRLAALHAAWKQLCGEGGLGLSVWLRDHLDPALAALLSDTGPFATCKATPPRHDPVEPLPADPLPDELVKELCDSDAGGSRPGLRIVGSSRGETETEER